MKNSTKRFCLKLAASILSTTIVASVALPMNVLATTVDTTTEILSENTTINSSSPDYSDNIIREVEEERDEFSKTFLMTDGTYYTYVSPVSIHEFVEDKWVDIDDSLRETPATISEAEAMVKAYIETVETVSGQISTFAFHDNISPITVSCIGNASHSNSKYTLPANSALVIKPLEITKFSMANQVLLSATLSVNIAKNTRNNSKTLYLKHITSDINATSYTDVNTCENIYYKQYHNTETEYSFDITNMYSKWERGLVDNNGVALIGYNISGTGLVFSDLLLSIRYKDVSANDSSFTYHTLDLGRAGVLSINDVTNAFKLEQTIAGLDCSLLPVTLTKTIDSAKFSLNSYANASSEWNYNYGLSVAGPYATLILPQGTIIDFKQPENAETTNGYQVWQQVRNRDYVDGATFHITESALNSTTVGDIYQDCYVDINGIEYWFNSVGRIEYIKKANKELKVEYAYFSDSDQLVINKLTDAEGNQYCISYSTYIANNNEYIYANKIEVKDSSNQIIMSGNSPLVIDVSNTVTDNMITSTFTYPSEANVPISVTYTYDLNGKLLYVQGTDGTITELHYKSEDNTYLIGYTQKKNNDVINTFTITADNTLERIFEGTLIQKETQRYNSDFQLITYYYGNNVMGINYAEGSIDSYAIKKSNYEEVHNLIDNGNFERPHEDSLWEPHSTVFPDYDDINKRTIIENRNAGTTLGITQFIEENLEYNPNSQNLKADTTYVFSAEVIIDDSIPSDDYALKATIELFEPDAEEPFDIFELPFDVSLLGEEQTRICSFKTDIECIAKVSIYASGQLGKFILDNVYVYEAATEDGSATIPNISVSDPITTTVKENDVVIKEYISDGTTYLLQEYDYAEDTPKIITTSDFNGVTTFYDYGIRNSKLSKKGYALKADESIENPISYTYNSIGLLSSVKQTINNIEPSIETHTATYTYDATERVTSVTNNGYSYFFSYDDIGNITNIKKESLDPSTTMSNNLTDYTYIDNNIGSIIYSNGYKVEYTYNEETGEITQIICSKKRINTNNEISSEPPEYDTVCSYTYNYDNGDIIETLIDNVNSTYDVKIKYTDTGMNIYHDEELVYSKSKSANNTVETYISSVSGGNISETFTKTAVTETKIGNNTEYYSAFSGSKNSSFTSEPIKLDFSGSNNVVKDYYGRTSSKYFTLDCAVRDFETQTLTQSNSLTLTHNYTYIPGESFTTIYNENSITGTRTSGMTDSITNIISSQSTNSNGTSTENMTVGYRYIYDDRGNVRFQFLYNEADDCYYLENYYQYDYANQIQASTSPDGIVFYSYDNNGNISEKQIGGEFLNVGNTSVDINTLGSISSTTWNLMEWDSYLAISFAPSKPEKKVIYQYDELGRLSDYTEQNYTYDSNGQVSTQLPEATINVELDYDSYGNPLKYVGESALGGTITADLTWNGSLLESAIIYSGTSKEQKLTFEYDENGYRISKTVFDYIASLDDYKLNQQIRYIWENGRLLGMQLLLNDNDTPVYMYTNILYDNLGVPYGITTPTGYAYYFLRDASDSVRGLINSDGALITYMSYDAFGNLTMDINGDSLGDVLVNALSAVYNPCTYKGYLYDYELGMYFIQNKCYSPKYGRFLSETSLETLTEPKAKPLDINLYLFCNNNPVNNFDVNAEWDRDKFTFASNQTHGIHVDMDRAFLSRPFCILYASKIISESGTWDYLNGRNLKDMNIERIASNLFARCVGNYAESAVNRVNATWGDGWIVSNRNSEIIIITETDPNADKYLKIWLAAPSIKSFATANGIYITL